MKILVIGSAGFVAGYLVEELLKQGHSVVENDNYSKYGFVEKAMINTFNILLLKGM